LTIGRPLVILTGGIATGKSTIAQRLRQHGIDVIDTDAIAHALTAPDGAALPELHKAFGNDIFKADGTLDRAALRDIVFNDPEQKTRLEQILHPMIRRQAIEAIAAATSPYVVADIPLFAETGFLREQADRVLVIDCPPDIQKQRLLARGNLPEELADLILQAQAPRDERLSLATEVLDNSGSPEQRDEQLDQIHQRYLALANSAENNDKNPVRV
ncbi:MAG: dephospho-CoA kinase, partial [Fluviibacter sp.]